MYGMCQRKEKGIGGGGCKNTSSASKSIHLIQNETRDYSLTIVKTLTIVEFILFIMSLP